jgi:probable F420-dependent oxidoreductase
MQLDLMLSARPLPQVGATARAAEEAGFGAIWFTEAGRTAYLSCTAAVLATERIGVGTAVAVAFPRSPMITASVAWELAEASGGRFTLGLGTQVKAHVERRYSSPFAPPGPRMRDYVAALRAIFAAFRGERLDFESEHYSHTLLPAQWSPGAIDVDDPPVFISAVGPYMSRLAGRACDGIHIHPFHSRGFLTDEQLPVVSAGAAEAGRTLDDVTLAIPVMTATGDTAAEIAATREHARMMIAFYGSTRSYSRVFEIEGFDGVSETLHRCQREGDVAGMRAAITDEILDRYIVEAGWSELGAALVERYRSFGRNVQLISYTANHQLSSEPDVLAKWAPVVEAVAAG